MLGARLKEERERLGLTQPAFAELAGAKKRTLIDWEGGVSSPTAVQLAALATHGADVLYILTGQRNPNPSAPRPTPPRYIPPPPTAEEQALLSDFRTTDSQGKRIIRATASAAARAVHADTSAPGRRKHAA